MRLLAVAAVLFGAALIALTVIHVVAPQRDGILALSQVGAPHLFLLLLPALLIALLSRRRGTITLLLLASVVGVARFGPGVISIPGEATDGEVTITVLAWNVFAGDADRLAERLLRSDAQIVSLEELASEHVRAIEGSRDVLARYPYRILRPDASVLGMGLLSAYPLQTLSEGRDPPHIRADVALPGGTSVAVLAAHPLPPKFGRMFGTLPISYDATERDGDLRLLRDLVDEEINQGEPVVVLGDLNVTDREPGYQEFVRDMRDAHLEVGLGPGSTWRPGRLAALPFGMLRIDYVLTGGTARPLVVGADCQPDGGDHCLLEATVAVGLRP